MNLLISRVSIFKIHKKKTRDFLLRYSNDLKLKWSMTLTRVRACVRACVRVCVRACVCVCVCVCAGRKTIDYAYVFRDVFHFANGDCYNVLTVRDHRMNRAWIK